jgi:hypothetical protein
LVLIPFAFTLMLAISGWARRRSHRSGRRTRLSERTCAAPAEILATAMARKRLRFRPPGLKPTTKIGTLGPYRGRLGAAWVIAPIVAGAVIVIAGFLMLAR